MQLLVTRPLQEALHWTQLLQSRGVQAQALPLIEIQPAPQPDKVQAIWQQLQAFDAVMFVSANAIGQFFALRPLQGAAHPYFTAEHATPRAYVTGPGSVAALRKVQVDLACVDAPSPQDHQFDSEALWAVVQNQVHSGFRLLIVRGAAPSQDLLSGDAAQGQGRNWFAEQVMAAGGTVQTIASYQRSVPQWTQEQWRQAQRATTDGSIWLFSSSEAVSNLARLCPGAGWGQARAVATHARIAQAVRSLGFGVVCESRPVVDAIVASIESIE